MKYDPFDDTNTTLPDNNEWVMQGKIRGLTHRVEEQDVLIKALQEENQEIIEGVESLIKQLQEKRLTLAVFAREIIDLFVEDI